jgi:hypothetical protein
MTNTPRIQVRVNPGIFWNQFLRSFTHQPAAAAALHDRRVRDAEARVLAVAIEIADTRISPERSRELREAVTNLRSVQGDTGSPRAHQGKAGQ